MKYILFLYISIILRLIKQFKNKLNIYMDSIYYYILLIYHNNIYSAKNILVVAYNIESLPVNKLMWQYSVECIYIRTKILIIK